MGRKRMSNSFTLEQKETPKDVLSEDFFYIYDPLRNPVHSNVRSFRNEQGILMYRYYEGYGQRNDPEKVNFMNSINREHELWSSDIPVRKIEVASHWPTSLPSVNQEDKEKFYVVGNPVHIRPKNKGIHFNHTIISIFYSHEVPEHIDKHTDELCKEDRQDKTKNVIESLLKDFQNLSDSQKDIFFSKGGIGTSNLKKELKDEYIYILDSFEELYSKGIPVPLTSQSYGKKKGGYPEYLFNHFSRLLKEFLNLGESKCFKFNPSAFKFIPGEPTHHSTLVRTQPPRRNIFTEP